MLLCFSAYALSVEFLNNGNFNNKISKGIVVVEYWADWNKANQFGGLEKFISTSFVSLESVGGKGAAHSKKMRKFLEKTDMMNHFNMAVEKNRWTKA